MAGLKYEIERAPDTVRLLLEGALDLHVAPELRQVLQRELASPPQRVLVDLGKVPFVDSSIIATLVEGLKLLRAQGADLRVENCQPPVRDTFEITRLARTFGIE